MLLTVAVTCWKQRLGWHWQKENCYWCRCHWTSSCTLLSPVYTAKLQYSSCSVAVFFSGTGVAGHSVYGSASQVTPDLLSTRLPPLEHAATKWPGPELLCLALHRGLSGHELLRACSPVPLLRPDSPIPQQPTPVEEADDADPDRPVSGGLCYCCGWLHVSQLLHLQHSVWHHHDLAFLQLLLPSLRQETPAQKAGGGPEWEGGLTEQYCSVAVFTL